LWLTTPLAMKSPGAGGDVVHAESDAEAFDRDHSERSVTVDCLPLDVALSRDRRIDCVEESEHLPQAAEKPNAPETVGSPDGFDRELKAEVSK